MNFVRSLMQQASNLYISQFVYVALVSALNREEIKTKKFRRASNLWKGRKFPSKSSRELFNYFWWGKKSKNEAFNDLCPQFCATMLLSINSEFASNRQSNSKHKFAKLFLHHKIRFSRKEKNFIFIFVLIFHSFNEKENRINFKSIPALNRPQGWLRN